MATIPFECPKCGQTADLPEYVKDERVTVHCRGSSLMKRHPWRVMKRRKEPPIGGSSL